MACFFAPCSGKKKDLKKCGVVGIRTLISKSQEHDDSFHAELQSVLATSGDNASVTCHKTCYSSYTSVSRNVYVTNKRKAGDLPHLDEPARRTTRSQLSDFIFKRDCLFCGLVCSPKNKKKPQSWVRVRQCETEQRPGKSSFKQVVLDVCDQRRDDWSREVEVRIRGAQVDLPAADAQYHCPCYDKFRKVANSDVIDLPELGESLNSVVDYMQANKCVTWTVLDLHDVYIQNGGHLTRKQMIARLSSHFGDDIVIMHLEGCSSIVGFRQYVSKSMKIVKQSNVSVVDECVDFLVQKVKEEVNNIPLSRDYDLGRFTHDHTVRDTSETLLTFMSRLVSGGETSKISLTLAQCIQQHINHSTNQTSLGLAVKLHHKFGSSDLVSTLHEHGIVSSYCEVLRFRKSAAKYVCENSEEYHRVLGLERRNGPIFSWCDNYDLVVFTQNGRRSTHAMAIEFTQHPSSTLNTTDVTLGVMRLRIPRLKLAEANSLRLTHRSLDIEHYTGPKKINPPDVADVLPSQTYTGLLSTSLVQAQNKDAAYYSQLRSDDAVEWSGFNSLNDRAQVDAHRPKTLCVFGPLIDSPPAHPDTVLTTMAYIDRTTKCMGMTHVHITLDMQLYIIACLIQWSNPSRWQSIVLRPGMMHTLMSFIGAIGVTMRGTGLEDLVRAAYGGIAGIMNGKAWPKSMRAFRMVVAALMHDFLQEGDKSHTDIAMFLDSTRTHPTGRLWTDCFIIPTMLAHQFMRAEREGDWLLQQHCLERMLPYFFVAGHHHYARYISWHIRAMQHIPRDAKQDLLNGSHVCRHTEGAAAVSGDQYGEQTYIKQGKQAGGLKGISTNPEQVAVWIESIGVCSHLAMAMDGMYSPNTGPPSASTDVKHKEEGSKRRELDRDDRLRILTELRKHSHPLTHPSDSLYNIVNGQVVSETEVNVQDAVEIGQDMTTSFASSLPGGFHHPIKKTVKTMQVLKRGVKIKGKTVYDLEAVFARLVIVGRNRNVDLADVFQHELCSVPPSLIDEYGCIRKGSKAVLVSRLGVPVSNPTSPDTLLVDASQLLYHIVWPSSGTVGDLAEGMRSRLIKYNRVETYVIFDRYDGISAKDHERQRRAGEGSAKYHMTLTSPLAGRDAIMKNKANKRQLSQLLCTHDIGSNIELVSRTDSIVRHDEADISLISYMLKAAASGAQIVRILSDDTDVFVLLVYWCKKADVSCAVQMERWNGSVLDINATVAALGDKCKGLLGMHALSGCDTVSYPNGRGKVSALGVLTQTDIDELDSVLGEESATQADLLTAGTSFFLSLYCQKESTSLNAARHDIYRKRKNPPPLKSLPPTDANLALHVQIAHWQMLLWKAADKSDPPDIQLTDYGWEVKEHEHVMPAISREPAAPSKLMDVISCSCKAEGKACSGRCSCGSNGLSCTSYCVCEGGNTCCNPHTQREEDEDEPQQSEVDSDDLAGEESD